MSIVAFAGGVQAFSSTSGGKNYAITLGTVAQTVAPANPSRQGLTFHNPGTVDIFVAPTLTNVLGTGAAIPFTPDTTHLAGTFQIFAGATLVIKGEIQTPWQAFAVSGAGNPLTVMDSNIPQ